MTCDSPVAFSTRIMCTVMWQEVADVLEAIVFERALQVFGQLKDWRAVAEKLSADAPKTWPKSLGDSNKFNVSTESEPLRKRLLIKLAKQSNKKKVVLSASAKALEILARTQVHLPPDSMSLWDWCVFPLLIHSNLSISHSPHAHMRARALTRHAHTHTRTHARTHT